MIPYWYSLLVLVVPIDIPYWYCLLIPYSAVWPLHGARTLQARPLSLRTLGKARRCSCHNLGITKQQPMPKKGHHRVNGRARQYNCPIVLYYLSYG